MTSTTTTATSATLREINARSVLDALRRSGAVTVSELMRETGLSRPTVHLACDALVTSGWVAEVGDDDARPAPGLGRPARRYALAADAGFVVGVDMGLTTVTALVVDLRGQVRGRSGTRLPAHPIGAEDRLARTRSTIAAALADAGLSLDRALAVAVGVPAPVDRDGHVLAAASYLPGLSGLDLAAELRDTLPCPVLVENDANLAVLAERWLGVAAGMDDVIVVLAGERLGAGLFVEGRLLHGHGGRAGEMGFLTTVDGVGGSAGIAPRARALMAEATSTNKPGPAVQPEPARAAPPGEPITAEAVFAAARAGDPLATAVAERVAVAVAGAVAPLAGILDPQLVVISGAVAQACDVLLAPLERRLAELLPAPPRVVGSTLGDRAVVLGAARLGLDLVESSARPSPA